MKPAPPDSDLAGKPELEEARRQRDLALVCAILMMVVTGVMLWNNFARDYPGLKDAQELVREHRALLTEHRKIQETVDAALRVTWQEADRLERMKRNSH